jgi:UDP-N-acetylmuramoyl-tripeptide--D-alanyl-D-alanine ligase
MIMPEGTGTLTLADLTAALVGEQAWPLGSPRLASTRIGNCAIDSRLVTEGSLFVAMAGERHDGHAFIPEALANGAAVIIAERAPSGQPCTVWDLRGNVRGEYKDGVPVCLVVQDSLKALQMAAAYWRRQHDVRVIGITGSVGKTTCKEMCAAVLAQRFRTLKNEGNYNNEIGLPLTILHLAEDHEIIVLEMGMYALGEIEHLANIALPQVGLVTNVGPSHLERLGTIERIAQAKSELPQALPPAKDGGWAVLNADDARVVAMRAQTEASVFTYGLDPAADLWADAIQSEGLDGIHFRLHDGQETIHVRVPVLGRHSVHTALAAASVGLVVGMSWTDIVSGLCDESAQIRLVAVPGPHGSTILDDTYNASPESSIAALNLLEELDGRKVAVLGDMYELGYHEGEGHKIVGRRAREVVDLLVAVGGLGQLIGEEALAAGMDAGSVYLVETNSQAIDVVQDHVGPGDIVLVKGSRGMQMEEIVAALAREPRATWTKEGTRP